MRLLKIGHDSSNNITFPDPRVSALHAELTVLNNGDILLEDKGSRNGTFVNGAQIAPGKPVSVKRGDRISFAGQELNWSSVPMPEDTSKYLAMYGIGTNYRNEIRLTGDRVSRFHATLKKGIDKKWYIEDHSKNGTTVNGQRITSGNNFRIKKGDQVSVAGQIVDLSSYMGSGNGNVFGKIAAIAAIVIAIVGLGFLAYILWPTQKPDPAKATVCVFHSYHYVVTLVDDPLIQVYKENGYEKYWPTQYEFGVNDENEIVPIGVAAEIMQQAGILKKKDRNGGSINVTGTAFFVDDKGVMLTNRHVAMPWEYKDNHKAQIRAIMGEIQQVLPNLKVDELLVLYQNPKYSRATINNWLTKYQSSGMVISGETDFLAVGQSFRMYSQINELMPTTVIGESKSEDIDVAIMQLNNHETPQKIVKDVINLKDAVMDPTVLKPGKSTFTFWGFPTGLFLNLDNNTNCGLTPLVYNISLSRVPNTYTLEFQGEVLPGASGSPVIDKSTGKLVGIMEASLPNTQVSMGVQAKFAVDLYNEVMKARHLYAN